MSTIESHLVEVKVPQLSESVTEATLLTWHKQVGEAVSEGENLIDVETDKVVLELPATKSGVLTKIIKADGEKVGSNEVIAQINTAAVAPQAAGTQMASAEAPARFGEARQQDHRRDAVKLVAGKPMWSASRR
ncbi:MAG: biotin/lipoyl-containing protein, partial [Gallionella sp.]